jgi:hypothetical protein
MTHSSRRVHAGNIVVQSGAAGYDIAEFSAAMSCMLSAANPHGCPDCHLARQFAAAFTIICCHPFLPQATSAAKGRGGHVPKRKGPRPAGPGRQTNNPPAIGWAAASAALNRWRAVVM